MKTSSVSAYSSVGSSTTRGGTFAVLIGILLLIEGVWGFFSPVVFGALTTNHLHAAIHIVLGALAIWAASRGHARGFLTFLGLLLVIVGLLWLVPTSRDLVVRLLNVNKAVAIVNVIVGAISLLVAAMPARPIEVDTRT